MDETEAQARLTLLRQKLWPFAEIRNWFGIELLEGHKSLLAQYRIWAEEYRRGATVLDTSEQLIHRNLFELFLQQRELLGVRSAAVQWGMNPESFVIVLAAALEKGYISEGESKGDFPGVYRASLINDFHKRLPKLARTIFPSYSRFVQRLHEEIQAVLGVEIHPLHCLTSQAVGEDPPDFAHDFDSITNEPMGIGFQVWLETNKPIQLGPDSCSWITYVRFEQVLKGEVLGRRDDQLEKHRDAIRKYLHL